MSKIKILQDCAVHCMGAPAGGALHNTALTLLPSDDRLEWVWAEWHGGDTQSPRFAPREYLTGDVYETDEADEFGLAPLGKIDIDWAEYMVEHEIAERVLT